MCICFVVVLEKISQKGVDNLRNAPLFDNPVALAVLELDISK